MICYICEEKGEEKKASFQCPDCKRYVCGKHTVSAYDNPRAFSIDESWPSSKSYYCSNCALVRNAAFEKTREEKQKEVVWWHTCDFCKRVNLEGPNIGVCQKCGKRFCVNCGWFKHVGYRDVPQSWGNPIKEAVIVGRCNKHAGSLWRIGATRQYPSDYYW